MKNISQPIKETVGFHLPQSHYKLLFSVQYMASSKADPITMSWMNRSFEPMTWLICTVIAMEVRMHG